MSLDVLVLVSAANRKSQTLGAYSSTQCGTKKDCKKLGPSVLLSCHTPIHFYPIPACQDPNPLFTQDFDKRLRIFFANFLSQIGKGILHAWWHVSLFLL